MGSALLLKLLHSVTKRIYVIRLILKIEGIISLNKITCLDLTVGPIKSSLGPLQKYSINIFTFMQPFSGGQSDEAWEPPINSVYKKIRNAGEKSALFLCF
jgi:hypothetical protein